MHHASGLFLLPLVVFILSIVLIQKVNIIKRQNTVINSLRNQIRNVQNQLIRNDR
jgi:succinate dehydrogenase hydrophobic anchor subunit